MVGFPSPCSYSEHTYYNYMRKGGECIPPPFPHLTYSPFCPMKATRSTTRVE